MTERGAKHLLLLSRSGESNEDARDFVNEFPNVSIASLRCDLSDEQTLSCTLGEYATKMPAV